MGFRSTSVRHLGISFIFRLTIIILVYTGITIIVPACHEGKLLHVKCKYTVVVNVNPGFCVW